MRRTPRRLAAGVALLAAFAAASPALALAASGLPSGRTGYRTLADYDADLAALADGHPGLVRRIVLPERSVEGREISGVEIAANVNSTDDGRPVFLLLGLHHAREWPSGEAVMEFATDLVKSQTDPRVAAILARERIVLVPVVNPDGFLESAHDPQRRTNCRAVGVDSPVAPCSAKHGVDLNRNYGAFWGGPGESPQPGGDTYRGTGPWSEPESRAVHEMSQNLQVTTIISMHTYSGDVLWPPGWRSGTVPDDTRLASLGNAMAAAAGYVGEPANRLYPVTGATEDWNYVAQGAFGYTIEMGGTTFAGPFGSSVVDQYLGSGATAGRGLREAFLLAAEEAADRRDHAVVEGHAPAGSVLNLTRSFQTQTSPICTDTTSLDGCGVTTPSFSVPDFVNTTLTVGSGGAFTWDVGPSTRPLVSAAGGTEAWTLSCVTGDATTVKDVVVTRGQVVSVDPCAAASKPVPVKRAAARNVLSVKVGSGWRSVLRSAKTFRAVLACSSACSVRERVRSGRTTLGRRVTALRRGRSTVVHLALSAAGRRIIFRPGHHRLVVTVLAITKDGQHTLVTRNLQF